MVLSAYVLLIGLLLLVSLCCDAVDWLIVRLRR